MTDPVTWPKPPAPPPPSPGAGWQPSGADRAGSDSIVTIGTLIALIPVVLAGVLLLLAPGFFAPLFDDRQGVLGAPIGLAFIALFAALTGLGVAIVRRFRSAAAIVVVVVACVGPAVFIVILAPAIVLIAINLKA
jgi:hypothetical protein